MGKDLLCGMAEDDLVGTRRKIAGLNAGRIDRLYAGEGSLA